MRSRGDPAATGPEGSDEPLPVPPETAPSDLQPVDDQQPGGGDNPERTKPPERNTGRFSLLVVDNETGETVGAELWPVRLDTILLSGRSQRLVAGWVLSQIGEAAERLLPGFMDRAIREVVPQGAVPQPISTHRKYDIVPMPVVRPSDPFVARWRRTIVDEDDGGI